VTLQEWSLGGPVLKLWIVCRSEIQDGHHDSTHDKSSHGLWPGELKNLGRGSPFNVSYQNCSKKTYVTLQEWSLGGPVLKLWILCRSEIQDGHHDSTYFNIGPYGNFTFSSFFGSHVGFQISTKNTNLVEDHAKNISGKFGWNLFSGFREEDLNVKS
jgi:hypothetical protein